MRNFIAVAIFISSILTINAQDRAGISVSTSSDTVLIGNFFEIKFTVENFDGQFIPPNMEDFEIVGGPNQSTMMSMINGKVSKSSSYSYYLKPVFEGVYEIGSARVEGEEKELVTLPIQIVVISNPDGIIQRPNQPKERSFDSFIQERDKETTPASPKRKTFRI